MTRNEFEQLRDLPDKSIQDDIVWVRERGMGANLVFRDVTVVNAHGFLSC